MIRPRQRYVLTAVSIFAGVYVILTIPFALWPLQDIYIGMLGRWLYSILALGLACELTELVLSFAWRPLRPLQISVLVVRNTTAVVMTVCNDTHPYYLRRLGALSDAGYDVFVLDDSEIPVVLPSSVAGKVTLVCRPVRKGAKAGNLNNWLTLHGGQYEYCIVLDADSVMTPEACDVLLRTALHSDNADVAVFQSKVIPENREGTGLLRKLLAAGARPRARVLERVHARLGVVLSFGHNQLLRLAPIRAIGGFDELLTSEDTVLSLRLASRNHATVLVNVWSHDTDPETVRAYIRRTTRWARQTIELFSRDWRTTPVKLKLLLCRHLISYSLPVVGVLLLGVSLWTGPESPHDVIVFLTASMTFRPGYQLYGLALWPILSVSGAVLVLRIAVAKVERVSTKLLVQSVLFGNAVCVFLLFPLCFSMLASVLGYRVRFVPTNSHSQFQGLASRISIATQLLGAGVLILLLLAGAFYHPGSLLVGFNFVWVSLIVLSPICYFILRSTSSTSTTQKSIGNTESTQHEAD